MDKIKIAAAVIVVGSAYYYWRSAIDMQSDAVDSTITDTTDTLGYATESTANVVDSLTGGFMKISAMARVSPDVLASPNVQAFLRVIRTGEGTSGPNGYNVLYGGGTFTGYADHPRQSIRKWGITSTAAGAYQALSSSWDETKRIMGLTDFSPRSQDLFAIGRIAARGALDDVLAGRFTTAIRKCNKEWASLPGSPYGQRTLRFDSALAIYQGNGGRQVETTALA